MGHRAIRWPGPPHRKQSPSRRRQSSQEWPRLLQNSHSPLVKQVEASTQVRAPPPLLRTPLRPPIQVAPRRRRAPRQDSPCCAAAPPPTPRRGNRRPSDSPRPTNLAPDARSPDPVGPETRLQRSDSPNILRVPQSHRSKSERIDRREGSPQMANPELRQSNPPYLGHGAPPRRPHRNMVEPLT